MRGAWWLLVLAACERRKSSDPQENPAPPPVVAAAPIVVDATTHEWLLANPGAQVRIDLANNTLTLPNGAGVKFPIEAFARYCLLNGVDELGYLLKQDAAIAKHEQAHA